MNIMKARIIWFPHRLTTINFDYLQNGFALNIGNPHVIFLVESLDKTKLLNDSKKIEMSNFFPSGVNINIVEIKTKKEI